MVNADLRVLVSPLADFAGALAAPIYRVNPTMGEHLFVVFAVVGDRGWALIMGAIVHGLYALVSVEGLTAACF